LSAKPGFQTLTENRQWRCCGCRIFYVCDKLRNGARYGNEILHANPRHACVRHGLGLMSTGVIIGKKIYFFKQLSDHHISNVTSSYSLWFPVYNRKNVIHRQSYVPSWTLTRDEVPFKGITRLPRLNKINFSRLTTVSLALRLHA